MSRVSYVMMNPGGDAELTRAVRGAMDQLIGETAREARIARDRDSRGDDRRQPDHASSVPRPRSDRARRRAVRADDRRRLRNARERLRPRHRARRLRLRAALHRRPRRRRRRRRGARRGALFERRTDADRRRRHQRRDRVRQQTRPARLLFADRPRLRGRADLLRPARGAGRDRARAHRPPDARAALQGDRLRPVVGRARLSRGDQDDRRHWDLRLGHHRGDRRDVSGGDHIAGRRNGRRARRKDAPRRARRPHVRLRAQARASRGSRSIRPTCAQSSSPRRRSTPAPNC